MSRMDQPWTSREVRFDCYPRTTTDRFEAFYDSLPGHYWDTWRIGVFGTLSIGSCDRVVSVSGWPWWLPAWVALRSVVRLAQRAGVGGDAVFVVVRSVLPPEASS